MGSNQKVHGAYGSPFLLEFRPQPPKDLHLPKLKFSQPTRKPFLCKMINLPLMACKSNFSKN